MLGSVRQATEASFRRWYWAGVLDAEMEAAMGRSGEECSQQREKLPAQSLEQAQDTEGQREEQRGHSGGRGRG